MPGLSESARTALLAALCDGPPPISAMVRSEVVRLVQSPYLLGWDALFEAPLECLVAAFSFDLSDRELEELCRYARSRVTPEVLLPAVGSASPVRDRLSQELLLSFALPSSVLSRRVSPLLLAPLAASSGVRTASTALAAWHLSGAPRPLVEAATAVLVRCPEGTREVLAALLWEGEVLDLEERLERFLLHVEAALVLDGVPVPDELTRFRLRLGRS